MLEYEFYLGHVEFHIIIIFLVSMESKPKKIESMDILFNYGYHVSLVTVSLLDLVFVFLDQLEQTWQTFL